MLIKYELITNLEAKALEDLNKIKPLIDNSKLKVNKSELARDLDLDHDWKTIDKYINGYKKKSTRNKTSIINNYYQTIKELLENSKKTFSYKRVLAIFKK